MKFRPLLSLLALAFALALAAGAKAETSVESGLFPEPAQAPVASTVQLPRSLEEIPGTPAVPADSAKSKPTGIPEPGTIAIGLAILGASCAGRVRQCWRETKPVVSSK